MTIRAALIDLDGTVVRGETLVDGADEGVRRLREASLDVLFLSNNPTKSSTGYAEKLRALGVDADATEVMTSGTATASYLREHHADDRIFVVGEPAFVDQLDAVDLAVTDDPDAGDVVVGSFDREFDYDRLTRALWALQDDDTAFVGTDPDRTVPTADGRVIPGSGAIIRAIAGASEREPDRVLGKPSRETVDLATERLDVDPSECLMIGDRLNTDIEMGDRAGMTTVLVLTGITDRDAIAAAETTPDHVIDSLADVESVLDARIE